jgi:TRAP-type C4-dicarboxylate transport system permease small subunit
VQNEDLLTPAVRGGTMGPLVAAFGTLFREVRRTLVDRFVMSCVAAALITIGGFIAFYLAWKGAAATLVVAVQIAYLISGGFAGLALVATGVGIFYIQVARRIDVTEELEVEAVLDRATALLNAIKEGEVKPPR